MATITVRSVKLHSLEPIHISTDDDGGERDAAAIEEHNFHGKKYVLKL